jgi:hypothetical protein
VAAPRHRLIDVTGVDDDEGFGADGVLLPIVLLVAVGAWYEVVDFRSRHLTSVRCVIRRGLR